MVRPHDGDDLNIVRLDGSVDGQPLDTSHGDRASSPVDVEIIRDHRVPVVGQQNHDDPVSIGSPLPHNWDVCSNSLGPDDSDGFGYRPCRHSVA